MAPEADAIDQAVRWIAEGGLVAYPTETVWGIGADARSKDAVEALRRFKGRDRDAPISVLVSGVPALDALGVALPSAARGLAERFWPGPLTLVVPCGGVFAEGVARDDGALGLRCSPHPAATALAAALEMAGVGPLTSTSLNRSGEPAARTHAEARFVEDAVGDALLFFAPDGVDASGDDASTVVDATGPMPHVLRWGAISSDVLTPALEEISAP